MEIAGGLRVATSPSDAKSVTAPPSCATAASWLTVSPQLNKAASATRPAPCNGLFGLIAAASPDMEIDPPSDAAEAAKPGADANSSSATPWNGQQCASSDLTITRS